MTDARGIGANSGRGGAFQDTPPYPLVPSRGGCGEVVHPDRPWPPEILGIKLALDIKCRSVYIYSMTTSDARRAYAREYYQRNKDKFRQYYLDNKASINDAARRWQAENPARYLWLQAKSRARCAGFEFNIEPSDVVIPVTCPVFGTPLFRSNGRQGLGDNTPSIDRTDPTQGYIKGNVAVISGKANRLKNRWTAPELRRKADWLESSRPLAKTKPDDLRRIADWLDSLARNSAFAP